MNLGTVPIEGGEEKTIKMGGTGAPLEEDGILGEMRDTGEGEGKSVSGGIRGDMGPGTIGPEGSIINSLSPDF